MLEGDGIESISGLDYMDIHRKASFLRKKLIQCYKIVLCVTDRTLIVDQIPAIPLIDDGDGSSVRRLGDHRGLGSGTGADIQVTISDIYYAGMAVF